MSVVLLLLLVRENRDISESNVRIPYDVEKWMMIFCIYGEILEFYYDFPYLSLYSVIQLISYEF